MNDGVKVKRLRAACATALKLILKDQKSDAIDCLDSALLDTEPRMEDKVINPELQKGATPLPERKCGEWCYRKNRSVWCFRHLDMRNKRCDDDGQDSTEPV